MHNERTYPTLLRLFAELGVADPGVGHVDVGASDDGDRPGVGRRARLRAGSSRPWRNLLRPAYLRMLVRDPAVPPARPARLLAGSRAPWTTTDRPCAAFLDAGGFSAYFRRHFMEPLVAAVWSCDPAVALDYPARYLFSSCATTGCSRVLGSPQWRTVDGGSRRVRRRVAAAPRTTSALGTKVTSVLRDADRRRGHRRQRRRCTTFDAVVVATHPDQALSMLAEPTAAQREVLAAMPYSRNVAQLHTDASLLPRAPARARASWNYLRAAATTRRR